MLWCNLTYNSLFRSCIFHFARTEWKKAERNHGNQFSWCYCLYRVVAIRWQWLNPSSSGAHIWIGIQLCWAGNFVLTLPLETRLELKKSCFTSCIFLLLLWLEFSVSYGRRKGHGFRVLFSNKFHTCLSNTRSSKMPTAISIWENYFSTKCIDNEREVRVAATFGLPDSWHLSLTLWRILWKR